MYSHINRQYHNLKREIIDYEFRVTEKIFHKYDIWNQFIFMKNTKMCILITWSQLLTPANVLGQQNPQVEENINKALFHLNITFPQNSE